MSDIVKVGRRVRRLLRNLGFDVLMLRSSEHVRLEVFADSQFLVAFRISSSKLSYKISVIRYTVCEALGNDRTGLADVKTKEKRTLMSSRDGEDVLCYIVRHVLCEYIRQKFPQNLVSAIVSYTLTQSLLYFKVWEWDDVATIKLERSASKRKWIIVWTGFRSGKELPTPISAVVRRKEDVVNFLNRLLCEFAPLSTI